MSSSSALRPTPMRPPWPRFVRAAEVTVPSVGILIHHREDDPAYRMMTRDIEGDERFFFLFAVLVLGGAALATFNLTAGSSTLSAGRSASAWRWASPIVSWPSDH